MKNDKHASYKLTNYGCKNLKHVIEYNIDDFRSKPLIKRVMEWLKRVINVH